MLDAFTREISARWGLGNQGKPLMQMLVAHIANPATGGLPGFLEQFRKAGWGTMVNSWMGPGSQPEVPTTAQVETVLGSGLVHQMAKKLGLSYDKVMAVVAGVLPQLVARMTPDGTISAVLPAAFGTFASEGKALLGAGVGATAAAHGAARSAAYTAPAATASPLPSSSGGLGKWLPWLIGVFVVMFGISYCSKTKEPVVSTAPSTVSTAPFAEPVAPVPTAPAIVEPVSTDVSTDTFTAPEGAGVLDGMLNGMPVLRVFFDTDKTDVAASFAQTSKALVDFLNANPGVTVVISGFNDPTGDAARNAELSKQRAQAVKAALEAAGVAPDRAVLEKPAETSDTGVSNAASRRVDVVLRR